MKKTAEEVNKQMLSALKRAIQLFNARGLSGDTLNMMCVAVENAEEYQTQSPQPSQVVERLPTFEELELLKPYKVFPNKDYYDGYKNGMTEGGKHVLIKASAIIAKKYEEMFYLKNIIQDKDNELYALELSITKERAEKEGLRKENNNLKSENSEWAKTVSAEIEANRKHQSELSALTIEFSRKQDLYDALSLDFENLRKENEQLKKPCTHEWVSSVAYKGARVCTKCGMIK